MGVHTPCSKGKCMRGLQPVEHRKASQRQVHGADPDAGGSAERWTTAA
jgi:hypothetical protein